MKTLLAVDGSDNSYEAVHALKYFSRAEQLTLLHALNVPRPAYPMLLPELAAEQYKTFEQIMREDGERLLDRIQSLLPMHAGPSTRHLRIGSPAQVIVSMAEEQKADLIVMGARGLGPIKEWLLGSVSHRVLTLASCATLIVNGPVKAMKQILLPLEGLSDAEAAIRFLQLKPFHEAVDVTLLTILTSTEPPRPGDAAAAAAATEKLEEKAAYIEGVAERLREKGGKGETRDTNGSEVRSSRSSERRPRTSSHKLHVAPFSQVSRFTCHCLWRWRAFQHPARGPRSTQQETA
ncbi:MAG: universal stress protein [Nitrospirae bacterium]|nr:MAG: universal stress protein [Nitrospirota bacterium]